MALATFVGCDGEPSIGITTSLPMNLRPPGAKESLLQEMCEPLRKYKSEHIRVIWARPLGPHGEYRGVAFTRTYFCSEVLKKNFKALP
jgi:hypothetical protein